MLENSATISLEQLSASIALRKRLQQGMSQAALIFHELDSSGKYPGVSITPLPGRPETQSGVALLAYMKDGDPHVAMTKRSESVQHFKGVVVFPGGKENPGEGEVKAALREFNEEAGAEFATGQIVGVLPPISKKFTGNLSFRTVAVIGVSEKRPSFKPNPAEVSEIVEISLAKLDRGELDLERIGISGMTAFLLEALCKVLYHEDNALKHLKVGFTVSPGEPADELIERTYRDMLKEKQDLAIVNAGHDCMKGKDLFTYVITAERGVMSLRREELPAVLPALAAERHSERYFSTQMVKMAELPLAAEETAQFLEDIRKLSRIALFNSYLKDSREEFGFVAKRTEAGTLITGRGSSKSEAVKEDLSLVTDVDTISRRIKVISTGKKASLNASAAHLIFSARPDINYIIHSHIPLPGAASVGRDTSPATAEDWECLEPLVRGGHNVISQPNHGVLILLKKLPEVYDILAGNCIYAAQAQHYDTAYHRFINSPRLVQLFSEQVARNANVLDLACGTGEVTKQLLAAGYGNLVLADISLPMISEARRKVAHLAPGAQFVQCRMQSVPFEGSFDGVIIRQAVNYLSQAELVPAFEGIRKSLRDGGKLVFNSFSPLGIREKSSRYVREERAGKILVTSEGNLVEGSRLYHGQRTEVFDSMTGDYQLIYDMNAFWVHSKDTFLRSLESAGFKGVEVREEGNSLYFTAAKSGAQTGA